MEFKNYITELNPYIDSLKESEEDFNNAVSIILNTVKNKKTIFIAGNGGSAAQAIHFSAELVGRFEKDRPGIHSICLNQNISNLTAISNDYCFEDIFSRQLETFAKLGDCLILLSTSGNSPNIINAAKISKTLNIPIISLTGKNGGKLISISDVNININGNRVSHIQEVHLLILHMFCVYIEKSIYNGYK